MKLTIKQEKFCNLYLETGNATDAYRQAYNCGNMKYDTIKRKAVELLKNGTITQP
jgi:phage terminase small subunit